MKSKHYEKEYSEDSFLKKIKKYALSAGKEIVTKALILSETLKDKDTPVAAKGVIVTALGYFIFPADAIPDLMPGVGYADDLGAIVAALATVAAHVKDEHVEEATRKLQRWFKDSEG